MTLTFSGYRFPDTGATASNANRFYEDPFTIKSTASTYDLVISDGSDPDILYGDGGGDSHIDPKQVLQSTTAPGVNTGGSINYEGIVRFAGSDGETYTAIIFDYDEDGANGVDNNNSDGPNSNGHYEEGFFLGFITNDFDPADDPAAVYAGAVPPPGTTLTRTADLLNTTQVNVYVCFAEGTEIAVAEGRTTSVQDLTEGDTVLTADHGPKIIRWIGSRVFAKEHFDQCPNLRPIRIRAGALAEGVPTSDLVVSPQHRILVRSKIAERMFGDGEVLVAAKQLCKIRGVDVAEDLDSVTYTHFLLDQHEVVIANGVETESLYTSPAVLRTVGPAARQEIFSLFPELLELNYTAHPARPFARGREGRRLAHRHFKNNKPLVSVSRQVSHAV